MNEINTKIKLVVIGWFILTLFIPFSGHRYSNDSTAKFETALAFITTGSFNIEKSETGWGRENNRGEVYTYYTIGSVAIMIPAAIVVTSYKWLFKKHPPEELVSFFITLQNLIVTSLIGLFTFLLLCKLEIGKINAFVFSNLLVLGSEMLQYSSTGWSEPTAFLFSLIGLYFLVKDYENWFLWSICCALAVLIRIEFVTFFAIFLLFNIVYKKIKLKSIVIVSLLFFTIFSIQLIFNFIRYENIFNFGYFSIGDEGTSSAGKSMSTISRYLRSFYYSYLSVGRLHFIWVSPLLILGILIPFNWRDIPFILKISLISTCISMLIIPLAGYNSWCWGNRYLYTLFPYILIPMFFIKNINKKPIFKITAIVSIIISILSTLINSHVVQEIVSKKIGPLLSIEVTASNFINATFWLHLQMFPQNLINTFNLLFANNVIAEWSWLRVNCLDIWPVGLASFLGNAYLSFILWIMLVISWFLYGKLLVLKTLK